MFLGGHTLADAAQLPKMIYQSLPLNLAVGHA